MTNVAEWTRRWCDSRQLTHGIDRHGRVVAALETGPDGRALREVRVARSSGKVPLVVFQVHSADRVSETHAPRVYAACNLWNSRQRLPRAWVGERDSTLGIVVEASVPVPALTEDAFRRTGDVVVDAAIDFWRWVDLNTDW